MSLDTLPQEKHYTLGIAGHIDHGKTTLTKALTGQDTDRLKEEKTRKISIELGFASFPLSSGKLVSIIDVPGHERFIRQMVAGVAGIDLVILVIAADEGVMPQTKEHLDILELLGIKHGLIVLTKVDKVDQEFLELVEEQVREETAGTFLADSPLLYVNSMSGQGIEALKLEIEKVLSKLPSRPVQGITRVPIDRVFSKKGFGTVITGTVYQGKVSVGDELELLPQYKKVKVRQIQVHGQTKEVAYAGQRVALNLTDVSKEEIKRGDTLVTVGSVETTQRIDIEFHMLPHLDFNLVQRSAVRLHLATSEIMGRIIFFDRNQCKPGESCFAQLELAEPVTTFFADRFIIRRPTPMTTIGGGMIIDPYAKKHRFGQQTIDFIASKKEGDTAQRAKRILELEGMQTLQSLLHTLGLSFADWQKEVEDKYADYGLKLIGGEKEQLTLITTIEAWEQTWEKMLEELTKYHQRYPLREGYEREQLRIKYYPSLKASQWTLLLRQAEKEEKIRVYGETVSRYDFKAKLREKDEQIWQEIQAKMRENPVEVPPWEELVPKDMPKELSLDLLRYLLRHELIIQLDEGRFLSKQLFNQLVKTLKQHTPNTFSIKDVRQVLDTSRKYLIPFLETMDRLGYTLRQDNERTWKIDY